MVAFPDTFDSFEQRRMERDGESAGRALKRGIKMALGTALLLAALGMWIVPAGDAAMQLIKLFVSIVMLGLGLMLMSALDVADDLPEVHVDTVNRQLRVVTMDPCGKCHLRGVYDLDSLSEVSIEGHTLTAVDAAGNQVVSIPLADAESEQALRELLPKRS